MYGYLLLACYLPAAAWTGIVYIRRQLHLGTIEQAIQRLLYHQKSLTLCRTRSDVQQAPEKGQGLHDTYSG